MKKELSIYYDATFQIVAPHRGMATYLNCFLHALELSGHRAVGLAPTGLDTKGRRNIRLFGFSNILLWEQFSIANFTSKNQVDCFIFPYNTGPFFTSSRCVKVLFLHDLIFMEPFSKIPLSTNVKQIIGRFYRRAMGPQMIKKADFIVTVSQYSKTEILNRYKIPESKITVIPNSIDISGSMESRKDEDYVPYFLNVGGDAPHKNTVFLINGYAALPQEVKSRYSLRIVGISNTSKKKLLNEQIKRLGEEDNIFIEDFLEEQELEALYKKSFLFIFPSLSEGFGIPLLEAMKFGCAIACSNTSSMPEVCGEAAFYFDPENVASFVETICLACNDKQKRLVKREVAARQVDYYSRANFSRRVVDWFHKNIERNINAS